MGVRGRGAGVVAGGGEYSGKQQRCVALSDTTYCTRLIKPKNSVMLGVSARMTQGWQATARR